MMLLKITFTFAENLTPAEDRKVFSLSNIETSCFVQKADILGNRNTLFTDEYEWKSK